ncbi:hypothetical protein [Klebsiella quasipneumoniae]|uniref:hypothetical protein n=1 Tax=Klebsiella quasipneumoniae TaxID=1463165 RepID=UPI0034E452D6
MMDKKINFIFHPTINETYSSSDIFDDEVIGLEMSVEYYDYSLDNFQREILHWFKPRFAAGKLLAGIQQLVKKQIPEIQPHSIEVNLIPEVLPFDGLC